MAFSLSLFSRDFLNHGLDYNSKAKKSCIATFDRDVMALDSDAAAWIAARAGQVRKPAIILDIDETSLSNWLQLKANGLTLKVDGPLTPTLDLFHQARAQGAAVFFITGRDETVRRATERNLRKAGYKGWAVLIMRPAGTTTPSAVDYKASQRAKIEAKGYMIIASIGDQPSDLAGGYAERIFLVPNPYYRIP